MRKMAAPSTAPAWPKNSVELRNDGSVSVDWSDAALSDAVLERFVIERLPKLLEHVPSAKEAKFVECVVNFSGNSLQQPGPIAALLESLREAPNLHVTVLRLHKNCLTDSVVSVLAEHIIASGRAEKPLMQLHLSDNELAEAGVRGLVAAAHSSGAYPRSSEAKALRSLGGADCRRRALWLRVECQRPPLGNGRELLQSLAAEGFPVCVLASREEQVPATAVVQMHPLFVNPLGSGLRSGEGKGERQEKSSGCGFWLEEYSKGKGKFSTAQGADKGKGKASSDGKGCDKGKGKASSDAKGCDKGKGKASSDGKGGDKGKGKASSDAKGCDKGKGKASSDGKGGGYKTDFCSFFEKGACDKGERCAFAHGKSELRPRGGDGVSAIGKGKGKSGGGQGCNSSESHATKGASGSGYKTDICSFFERGVCEKGESCKFAHGSSELRPREGGGSAAQRPPQQNGEKKKDDDEHEAMVWLKIERERPGEAGQEFEAAWKRWCADQGVRGTPKAQRLATIVAFRRLREGGADAAGDSAGATVTPAPAATADAIAAAASSPGPSWRARSALAVRLRLERAFCLGALDITVREPALRPKNSGSESTQWFRYAELGMKALERGCAMRATEAAGSFFIDPDSRECTEELHRQISELQRACSSREHLSSLYQELHLADLAGSESQWAMRDAAPRAASAADDDAAAVLGALLGELSDSFAAPAEELSREAARAGAEKALLDYIFLIGSSRLVHDSFEGDYSRSAAPKLVANDCENSASGENYCRSAPTTEAPTPPSTSQWLQVTSADISVEGSGSVVPASSADAASSSASCTLCDGLILPSGSKCRGCQKVGG